MNVKAIILKGKNNYISKNKLNKIILKDHIYMTDKDINECITLLVWSHYTKTGDIEERNGLNKSDLKKARKIAESCIRNLSSCPQ